MRVTLNTLTVPLNTLKVPLNTLTVPLNMISIIKFGLNPGEIGLLLMGYSLSNAIISPVIGILMDYGLTPLKGILFGKI